MIELRVRLRTRTHPPPEPQRPTPHVGINHSGGTEVLGARSSRTNLLTPVPGDSGRWHDRGGGAGRRRGGRQPGPRPGRRSSSAPARPGNEEGLLERSRAQRCKAAASTPNAPCRGRLHRPGTPAPRTMSCDAINIARIREAKSRAPRLPGAGQVVTGP
jgi:hypothetical protein